MEPLLLNGKLEAKKITKSLEKQIAKLQTTPGLAVILIGNNPASKIYLNIKEKKAKELGVYLEKHILPCSVSEKKVLELMKKLNRKRKIHGILLQLPLPKKFNTKKIISAIDGHKDVDGLKARKHRKHENTENIFNPCSRIQQAQKQIQIIPPSIQAILHLIKITKIDLKNKEAVILANSPEFAEPLKFLLERKRCRVDILLKKDLLKRDLRFKIYDLRLFDIIIVALGKKHFLKPEMIKKNAIVIDVGINRINKKIFGDVHPDCFKKSKYISPVPGGVGPLTVVFLFKNLIKLVPLIL